MIRATFILVAVFLVVGPAVAAGKPATEAAKDAPAQQLKVTVVSVTGQAEKLVAGQTDKWEPIKAGEKLDELTVIRTGLRSKVALKFDDRGEVTVGSATKIGISQFRKQGNSSTTRLGLKYGSMSATVDSTRGPNDTQISTPVATLSVRGSKARIGFAGGLKVAGQAGQWRVAGAGKARTVGAGESTDGNLTPSIKLAKHGRDGHMGVTGLAGNEIGVVINNRPNCSLSKAGITTWQGIRTRIPPSALHRQPNIEHSDRPNSSYSITIYARLPSQGGKND